MNRLPCKDCITLAVCKAFVKANNYTNSVIFLTEKCSIIKEYLESFSIDDIIDYLAKRDEVFKFLGLSEEKINEYYYDIDVWISKGKEKSMNKLPCEDCITLGICKSYAKSNDYKSSIWYLYVKCSLARKYIYQFILRKTKQ